MKVRVKKPAVSYVNTEKNVRIPILPKVFSDQILTRKEQEIIEDFIVMKMCAGWNKELIFTGIRFRLNLILVDCAKGETPDWLRTIVPTLRGYKRTEQSTCTRVNIPAAHMGTAYNLRD